MRIHREELIIRVMFNVGLFLTSVALSGCGASMSSDAIVSDEVLTAAAAGSTFVDDGDCCVEADHNNPRRGCNVASIEACVCDAIPECCIENWSMQCVGAVPRCGGCGLLTDDERAVVALLVDSDRDGMLDLDEILAGLNPNDPTDGPDIDGDGIPNGEDDDVDGDGVLNAYDDDVDGDGIDNEEDDDIDGDGLLNRILDEDDDGDGIDNLIDNDDNADGLPDPEDEDDDDDTDDDDEEEDDDDEKCGDDECSSGERCILNLGAEGDEPTHMCATECGNMTCDRNRQNCVLNLGNVGDSASYQCVDVPECDSSNDMDGDGVCDEFDPDVDGDGDRDDDDDGLRDNEELALGTDFENADSDFDGALDLIEAILGTDPNDPDTDDDGLSDGQEIQLGLDPQSSDQDSDGILDGNDRFVDIGPNPFDSDEGVESADDENDEDDANSNEGDEITTGDLDLTEDDEGAGLPIEPDGEEDDEGDDQP